MTPAQRENVERSREPTLPIGWSPRAETEAKRKNRIRMAIFKALRSDGFDGPNAFAVLDAIEGGAIPHVRIDWGDED